MEIREAVRRINPWEEGRKVREWNRLHPVETKVRVRLDGGSTLDTKTVAPATLLNGTIAVLWLEGVSGCYRMDWCEVMETTNSHE